MATDPVCGMYVREHEAALRTIREGRTYFFCSRQCLLSFEEPEKDRRWLLALTAYSALSGLLLLVLMYVPRVGFEPADTAHRMVIRNALMMVVATPVQFVAGARFYRGLLHALRARAANMDTLIALGTSAAYAYSAVVTLGRGAYGHDVYFDVSVLVIAFILLGRALELAMKRRATSALRHLLDLQPRHACVVRGDEETDVPIEQVKPGDRVRVRAGERVPTDGRILEGRAAVDESMVTGESVPAAKEEGDDVVAGTLNTSGLLLIEARRVGRDTFLAQVAGLVESAQAGRAPIQRLVDAISAVFVPVVLLVAATSFVGWWLLADRTVGEALLPAVAVLIIACPCALGLATPAALLVTVAKGAETGVLVKEPDQLEALARVDVVLFDKTGTLTTGRPEVTDVIAAPGIDGNDVVGLAAAAEAGSTHPLAVAVVAAARGRGLHTPLPKDFREDPGHGVVALVEGQRVLVGTPRWLEKNGVARDGLAEERERLQEEGRTVLLVARDDHVVGAIALLDQAKEGARQAVASLTASGIQVHLVTGDNRRTGEAIAAQVGIENVHAEVQPADKAALVDRLRSEGRRVAMVGDGINDAPALAAADVGIALGGGTEIAREAGGLVLLSDDPRDVANAHHLARRGMAKIRANLFWAFFYNVALIPLAAFGLFHPILAGAAMGLSSATVVGNSLLLRRVRPRLASGGARVKERGAPAPVAAAPKKIRLATGPLGGVLDPVCGMTVDPARSPHRFEHWGNVYHFCSRGCLERFRTDPAGFKKPRGM